MDDKHEEKTEQMMSSEAARLRASAQAHLKELKEFWITFATTGVIMIAFIAFAVRGGFSWFVSNTQIKGSSATISSAGQADFALATVGNRDQGVYDSLFGLSGTLTTERIDGTNYYIASGNSSFRLDSDKNLNNYLADADLRPGNRGSFDLYVICRTDKRDLVLRPIFSAWHVTSEVPFSYKDAFTYNDDTKTAAEFLKGHILLFANVDEKGMYSGNIDFTEDITINLEPATETGNKPEAHQGTHTFNWGKSVYKDENTEVYRLSVYWVWPEQFGNFIYTGNSYNKNLFADKDSWDYKHFISAMESDTAYIKFFSVEADVDRPKIETITSATKGYQTATKNYELYSGWYNAADEQIGAWISYIQLGFEVVQGD